MWNRSLRLGVLERQLLDWLFQREWVDVRTAHAAHESHERRSPNTIHSTLERLIRKGLVERRREGRGFTYRARITREAFLGRTLADALDDLPGCDARSLLTAFGEIATRLDDAALSELERLVAEQRRARGERAPEAPADGTTRGRRR